MACWAGQCGTKQVMSMGILPTTLLVKLCKGEQVQVVNGRSER